MEIQQKREYYQDIGKNFQELFYKDTEKMQGTLERLREALDLFAECTGGNSYEWLEQNLSYKNMRHSGVTERLYELYSNLKEAEGRSYKF